MEPDRPTDNLADANVSAHQRLEDHRVSGVGDRLTRALAQQLRDAERREVALSDLLGSYRPR